MAGIDRFTEAEIQAFFKKFDTNNDKVIDRDEFASLLKEVLNRDVAAGDVDKMFKDVDENSKLTKKTRNFCCVKKICKKKKL